ncbi:MarR family transcriptional regulator [Candidatus Palauibacter sp.]|uniref:MarR family transcriptional regulator n=1 Tax=Candidatus Palauibacter sp. TaxID=3101350 RepID=UPI003C6F5E2F
MKFKEISSLIPELLSGAMGLPIDSVQAQPLGNPRPDLRVRLGEYSFVVEFKHAGTAEAVGAGVRTLAPYRTVADDLTIPLLVVPYMGDVGHRIAENAGLSWLDLSGNASIRAPGLTVRLLGRPNRFPRRGKPRTLFAPRGSRIVRHLLLHPNEHFSQKELWCATGVDKGYISRHVRSLAEAGLVTRERGSSDRKTDRIRVKDPDLLLDVWAEVYRFEDHRIWRGSMASRSGEETLTRVGETLTNLRVVHAFTGLVAAWLYSSYASFRLVTAYVKDSLPVASLETAGVREQSAGANVWIVVPNDDGVFHGSNVLDGTRCVSAVQTFLDLKAQPERAAEAAQELRRSALPWSIT